MISRERSLFVSKDKEHLTTSVIILSQEVPPCVLLRYHPVLKKWGPPGGHRKPGERINETGIREVREETGIDIGPYIPQAKTIDSDVTSLPAPDHIFMERINYKGKPTHNHLDFVYIIAIPYQKTDFSERVRWVSRGELNELPIFENVRQIIEPLLSEDVS